MTRKEKRRQTQAIWKRDRKKAQRKVRKQTKRANIRAKYGPNMKPAPVTIIRPGMEPVITDQEEVAPKKFAVSLNERAERAGYRNYRAYLASPEWKARRRQAMTRDGWRCIRCRSKRRLQVHHRWYSELGSEPLRSLETLCERCHQRIHS